MKRFIRTIIPCLIIFIVVIIISKARSPFKTQEEKQVGKMYYYSVRNINTFKLKKVEVNLENEYVEFKFQLKFRGTSNAFMEYELEDINTIIERMIQYLNEKDNFDCRYKHIGLTFYASNGRLPEFLSCTISVSDQEYFFDGIDSHQSNELYDLSVMKSVTSIYLKTGMSEYNDEKISKFAGNNLKEIYFTCDENYIYKDSLKEELLHLEKGLKVVLPDIKVYLNEEEIEMQDSN